jgi:hypothetical protein
VFVKNAQRPVFVKMLKDVDKAISCWQKAADGKFEAAKKALVAHFADQLKKYAS